MGSGAAVMGNCTVDNLATYYSAGHGYLVIDGRSVDYYLMGRWGDEAASINDRAARHAELLANNPGHDYDINLDDSDEMSGINEGMDPPYEESYDGDMPDDHPMVIALMDGGATPDEHELADDDTEDGWVTLDESSSATSEPYEPLTNTRGHDRNADPYNWDWIPDFDTESDEPCNFPRDLKARAD